MPIWGVIAEYDPFHLGHAYHLQAMREAGATHIAVALGADFTQRGECSLLYRRARARAALAGGADLVLALPVTGTLAGAERFARAGIGLLSGLGCVTTLSCGSECGDTEKILSLSEELHRQSINEQIAASLGSPRSFAAIREEAVREVLGEDAAALLKNPNDILALEYANAIRTQNAGFSFHAVKRQGAGHEGSPQGGFASAGYLRSLDDAEKMAPWIPEETLRILREETKAGRAPGDTRRLESFLLGRLRSMTDAQYADLPDCSEGLEHRLQNAARTAASLKQLEENIKTKRYPLARVRRVLWQAALGIGKEDAATPPQYLWVLGASDRGLEILSEVKHTATLPLVTCAQDAAALTGSAKRQWELDQKAADCYALCMPSPAPCGYELTEKFGRK